MYERLGVTFPDDESAEHMLELVRYANAHTQLPLIDDEILLIARYPEQARRIITIVP